MVSINSTPMRTPFLLAGALLLAPLLVHGGSTSVDASKNAKAVAPLEPLTSWGGPILGGYAGMDFELLPLAFVVVIIGGMGSLKGALIGAIVVGMIDNFGKALVPELSYFTLFAPMVLVLALKPTGLYGRA